MRLVRGALNALWMLPCAAVHLVSVVLLATFVEVWLSPAPTGTDADVAIVLGAAVWRDRPSPVLVGRLEQAAELLQQHRVRAVIVTGGRARGDRLSEAEAGRRFLMARGIASERVLLEDRSTTTFENLAHARALMRASAQDSALLISDPLHLRRAQVMASDLGLAATPSPTPHTRYRSLGPRLRFAARETVFLTSYRGRRALVAIRAWSASKRGTDAVL